MRKMETASDLSCQSHLKKNKTNQAAIYINEEHRVGGDEVVQGVLEKNFEEKGVEPAILSHILDALSQGIAKSIVEAAIESISPVEDTYTKQGSA